MHRGIVMLNLCIISCVFSAKCRFLNHADVVSLYGCISGNISCNCFVAVKKKKARCFEVGGLQALEDLRSRWKSLPEASERLHLE